MTWLQRAKVSGVCPHAQKIVVRPGEACCFLGFTVTGAKPEQIHVHFIQEAPLFVAADHTLDPKKARQAVSSSDWSDLV